MRPNTARTPYAVTIRTLLALGVAAGLSTPSAGVGAQSRPRHAGEIRHAGSGVRVLLNGALVKAASPSVHPSEVDLSAALRPGRNELTLRWRPEVEDRPPIRIRVIRIDDGTDGRDGGGEVLVDWTSPETVEVGKTWQRSFTLVVDG